MALGGQLKDFGLLKLLALVQKTDKSGALVLDHWEESATIHFRGGKLTKVRNNSRDLATALLQAGKINHEQYQRLRASLSEKAMAILLSDDGIISRHEIEGFARRQMVEDLFPMFTWTDGTFKMDLNAAPSEDDIVVSLDLLPILSRARSLLKEWERLVSTVPSLDVPLRLVQEPASSTQICLTTDEWKLVVALAVTKPPTLSQLAQQIGFDEPGIRRVAGGLIARGLAVLPSPQMPTQEAVNGGPGHTQGSLSGKRVS